MNFEVFSKIISLGFVLTLIFFYSLDYINKTFVNCFNSKINISSTPLLGGTYLVFILFFVNLELFLFGFSYLDFNIFLYIFPVYLLGLVDDFKNIKPSTRILASFFISGILILSNNNLIIYELNLFYFSINFNFYTGLLFTVICFIALQNTMNFIDGINGLSIILFIQYFSILFYFNNDYRLIFFLIILFLTICFFINIANKFFLGDSGIYFLSYLLGTFVILTYKSSDKFDQFFIMVMFIFPFLDLLRLIIERSIKGKSPFVGDKNHIHHICKNRFGNNITLLIFTLLILISCVIYFFTNKFMEVVLLNLFIYLILYSLRFLKNE